MRESIKIIFLTSLAIILGTALPLLAANAAEKKKAAPAPEVPAGVNPAEAAEAGPERVNVENIKEKYWARGDESELGVVQNRLYSKANKFNLGIYGGIPASDPFLSTKALGARFGYHFNETWSLHLMGFKHYVSDSSAKVVLEDPASGAKRANTNPPKHYYGGEIAASVLYGKLSLLGKKILYYDMHLLAGAGRTATESGENFTSHFGVGQQIFLTKWSSLRVDYRAMHFNENIIEKQISTKLGQVNGERSNWTHTITIGFDFFVGKPTAEPTAEEAAK